MSTTSLPPPPFTATEARMLAVLGDGRAHRREELHHCLADDLGAVSNIQPHLSAIRRKLRARGEGVVCELVNRRVCYRHVRLLVPLLHRSC